jgi:agmatinase
MYLGRHFFSFFSRIVADITGIAAADIVYDFLAMLQLDSPPLPHGGPFSKKDLVR